ncbi:MAG: hypothetical protein HY555_02855 [Euryarchaeota archaeon]|nr:hypothetical protein [Euryarchaeota archaeon]
MKGEGLRELYLKAKALHLEATRDFIARDYRSFPAYIERFNEILAGAREELKIEMPFRPLEVHPIPEEMDAYQVSRLGEAARQMFVMVAYLTLQLRDPREIAHLVQLVKERLAGPHGEGKEGIVQTLGTALEEGRYEFSAGSPMAAAGGICTPDYALEAMGTVLEVLSCRAGEEEVLRELEWRIAAYEAKYEHVILVLYSTALENAREFERAVEGRHRDVHIFVLEE